MQARHLAGRHRLRVVLHLEGIEPAAFDPEPIRTKDVRIQAVADDNRFLGGDERAIYTV